MKISQKQLRGLVESIVSEVGGYSTSLDVEINRSVSSLAIALAEKFDADGGFTDSPPEEIEEIKAALVVDFRISLKEMTEQLVAKAKADVIQGKYDA